MLLAESFVLSAYLAPKMEGYLIEQLSHLLFIDISQLLILWCIYFVATLPNASIPNRSSGYPLTPPVFTMHVQL